MAGTGASNTASAASASVSAGSDSMLTHMPSHLKRLSRSIPPTTTTTTTAAAEPSSAAAGAASEVLHHSTHQTKVQLVQIVASTAELMLMQKQQQQQQRMEQLLQLQQQHSSSPSNTAAAAAASVVHRTTTTTTSSSLSAASSASSPSPRLQPASFSSSSSSSSPHSSAANTSPHVRSAVISTASLDAPNGRTNLVRSATTGASLDPPSIYNQSHLVRSASTSGAFDASSSMNGMRSVTTGSTLNVQSVNNGARTVVTTNSAMDVQSMGGMRSTTAAGSTFEVQSMQSMSMSAMRSASSGSPSNMRSSPLGMRAPTDPAMRSGTPGSSWEAPSSWDPSASTTGGMQSVTSGSTFDLPTSTTNAHTNLVRSATFGSSWDTHASTNGQVNLSRSATTGAAAIASSPSSSNGYSASSSSNNNNNNNTASNASRLKLNINTQVAPGAAVSRGATSAPVPQGMSAGPASANLLSARVTNLEDIMKEIESNFQGLTVHKTASSAQRSQSNPALPSPNPAARLPHQQQQQNLLPLRMSSSASSSAASAAAAVSGPPSARLYDSQPIPLTASAIQALSGSGGARPHAINTGSALKISTSGPASATLPVPILKKRGSSTYARSDGRRSPTSPTSAMAAVPMQGVGRSRSQPSQNYYLHSNNMPMSAPPVLSLEQQQQQQQQQHHQQPQQQQVQLQRSVSAGGPSRRAEHENVSLGSLMHNVIFSSPLLKLSMPRSRDGQPMQSVSWKRRYAALVSTRLFLFRTPYENENVLSVFDLANGTVEVTIQEVPSDPANPTQWDSVITLHATAGAPGSVNRGPTIRHWVLRTNNSFDGRLWHDLLQRAAVAGRSLSTVPPPNNMQQMQQQQQQFEMNPAISNVTTTATSSFTATSTATIAQLQSAAASGATFHVDPSALLNPVSPTQMPTQAPSTSTTMSPSTVPIKALFPFPATRSSSYQARNGPSEQDPAQQQMILQQVKEKMLAKQRELLMQQEQQQQQQQQLIGGMSDHEQHHQMQVQQQQQQMQLQLQIQQQQQQMGGHAQFNHMTSSTAVQQQQQQQQQSLPISDMSGSSLPQSVVSMMSHQTINNQTMVMQQPNPSIHVHHHATNNLAQPMAQETSQLTSASWWWNQQRRTDMGNMIPIPPIPTEESGKRGLWKRPRRSGGGGGGRSRRRNNQYVSGSLSEGADDNGSEYDDRSDVESVMSGGSTVFSYASRPNGDGASEGGYFYSENGGGGGAARNARRISVGAGKESMMQLQLQQQQQHMNGGQRGGGVGGSVYGDSVYDGGSQYGGEESVYGGESGANPYFQTSSAPAAAVAGGWDNYNWQSRQGDGGINGINGGNGGGGVVVRQPTVPPTSAQAVVADRIVVDDMSKGKRWDLKNLGGKFFMGKR